MRKSTALLLTPTIEEVRLAAAKMGLPEREADKFFYHYESNGWKVGRVRMASFTGALSGWKLRWEERTYGGDGPAKVNGSATAKGPMSGADKMIYQKEFERCLERIRVLRSSYGEMQTWTAQDKAEYAKIKARQQELKKLLGIVI